MSAGRSRVRNVIRIFISQLVIAAVCVMGLSLDANATTIGFAFLLTILGIAVYADLAAALLSSFTAVICFNYFFLPPVRTFTIADPSNWVALGAFFITSIVASRLVLRARVQATNADARRNEVEALYALSVDLFTSTNRLGALGEAAARALTNVGATGGGLVLFGTGASDREGGSPYDQEAVSWYAQQVVSWSGPQEDEIEDLIAGVGRHKRTLEFPARYGRDVYLPLNIGGTIIGVLAARSTTATLRALESAATLVALAVERERFLAAMAHVQAVREGDELKTSLLRAVSHDLATPLTAIALQIEALRSFVDDPRVVSGLDQVADASGRLRRRIENLLAMARLEAHSVVPRPEPTPAADLFRAAREHLSLIVQHRPLAITVAPDCPDVFVDPSLALEVLVNLIENAHQASGPGSPLELSAYRHPLDSDRVRLEVADRGSGIGSARASDDEASGARDSSRTSADQSSRASNDQSSRASADPSDTPRHGLGLEIARSLSVASGGQVTLAGRPGGGAVARIDLPAAHLPDAEEVPA